MVNDPFENGSCSPSALSSQWPQGTFGKMVISKEGGMDVFCRVKKDKKSELQKWSKQKIMGILRGAKNGNRMKSIEVNAEIILDPPGVRFKFEKLCEEKGYRISNTLRLKGDPRTCE